MLSVFLMKSQMEVKIIGNYRKGDPCPKMTEKSTELCYILGWKTEIISDEPGYLAEISRHRLKVQPRFFLLLIVKCEKDKID